MTHASFDQLGQGTDQKRLSVLVVTPKGFIGGAERWLLSLLDNAPRLLVTVVVLHDEGALVDGLRERGIETVLLPTGAGARDVATAAVKLRAVLKSRDPDVVLANGIKAATVVLGPARSLGVPAVWVRHEDSYWATLGRLATTLADCTLLVAPPTEADHGYAHAFVAPPVLDEPLPAAAARASLAGLGVPDDGLLRVGMFSRLVRYKGIDTVIKALPAAKDWRLVVAGIHDPGELGDERGYLEALATELGVADRVSWLGEVPAAGRLAAGLDAVAVPTRDDVEGYPPGEGFGLTVVEAFAAGVPVLADPATVPAIRLAGYDEAIVRIDCHDPASVGAALTKLSDEPLRSRLGARAAELGAAHPRPVQVGAEVTRVLAKLAHQPGIGLTDTPALSVVSTVFNESRGIDEWLVSLTAQLGPDDEIVVVDGGSADDTPDRIRAWESRDPRVRLIESPGAGISAGRNIGIDAARTDWVACTDAGCTPDPGWLDALRRGAAEEGVDLVTGVYRARAQEGRSWELALVAVGYPVPEELRRATPLVRGYTKLFGRAYDATLPTGRSVAFTKEAWRAAGGYPEDLATAEDVLFGKRAVAAGAVPVLAVDAGVTWDQRPTLRGNVRMYRGYGRGDGQSGDRQLVARDLARAGVYTVAPVLWLAAPRTRPLLAAAAAVYLSLPLQRAVRGDRPVTATALVPAMAAMRDVAKAVGCLEGMRSRRRSTS